MKPQSESHLQPWRFNNKSSSQISLLWFAVFLQVVSSEVIESQFLVKTLPGFLGELPFTLETGQQCALSYIGVGESDDVQLFYYFIESEGNPKDDPLMLWLTGGPGCSGLSGLLYEIGPLTIDFANSTLTKTVLKINPFSWTKAANIIFLDQPAGTGYSYAKTPEASITNDTLSTMQAYQFLKKWLVDHPKFLHNTLYVAGDSYSGIVLPMIVQEIYDGNEVGEGPKMNIKGYILGNPFTDTSNDYNSRIPYAHRMALLSDAIYKVFLQSTKENCNGEYLKVDPDNSLCINDLQVVDECIGRIYLANILEPSCKIPQLQIQWCRDGTHLYSSAWANSRDVREALHVSEALNNIEWVRCNETMHFYFGAEPIAYTHNVLSVVGYHQRLAHKNCRALVYSGDHDMVVPYFATLNWIESLNLSVGKDWRPWFVNDQVAGYTMEFLKNEYSLTYATIKVRNLP
ncbi:hypothetical protein OSB04_030948 [Centaurea solstitialis]|uniref:Uncharacterized protein n=1 Tax=Centaurea solstitialis TaxID=347529 RepID=A0AA38S8L1_9ASTR|nr:hypothetical protein OSB04_030948 [Centaurea solstitialis]